MPDDAGAPAIEVIDVVKDFGRRRVIDGLSFAVPRGQVCALLGPNGAGKTTTIHMLLGLTLPSSGTIRILGTDVVADRSAALARTNFTASYVSLPWRLKVRELLRIYSELYEVPDPDAAIAEVGELLGIDRFLDRLGQSLSTGQQTIVLLAKALVNRPELLFLDEPTASLDPERAVAVRTLLRRIADERGMTILITSHNMTRGRAPRGPDPVRQQRDGRGRLDRDRAPRALRRRRPRGGVPEGGGGRARREPSAEMLVADRGPAAVDLMGDDDRDGGASSMSYRHVKGVLLQNLYVMKHSPLRIMEMIYWPFIEIILWGFIATYLRAAATSRAVSASCSARSCSGTCASARSRSWR